MRWTDDVREALRGLDRSPRTLRRFGLVVGGALVAVGLLLLRRHPDARLVVAAAGAALLAAGALAPGLLRGLHPRWMALAFALGWLVSRLILVVVFAVAVTPLALLARASGKRFLDLRPDPGASSHWVRRPAGRPARYEKMY
jgi:hypothetical protein